MAALTLIIEEVEAGGYVGQIKEIPDVLSQGETKEELRVNILDALKEYLMYMKDRELTNTGNKIYEEPLELA